MQGKEGIYSRGTNKEEPTGSGKPLYQGERGGAYIQKAQEDSKTLVVTAEIKAPLLYENFLGEKKGLERCTSLS